MLETKAFIFDLFGVLSELFNQRWMRENVTDKPEVISELLSIMHGLDVNKNTQADFFRVAAKAVGKTAQVVQEEMESRFQIYPEMFKIVSTLREKYKVALFSNASAPYARELFKKKGIVLENHFDRVFISSEIMLVKPDPAGFNYCASQLGAAPEECAFVDDAQGNVAGAEKLDMKTHLFTSQPSFEKWLADNF